MTKTDICENARGRAGARELIMKLLFQMEVQKEYGSDTKTKFFKEYFKDKDKKQEEYLEQMYALICSHLKDADHWIESCSDSWKIERMCKVDLAVMRIAILEIMHMKDIPESVSINEAVNIAKKYGTEDSGKFVNGVLGKVVKINTGPRLNHD